MFFAKAFVSPLCILRGANPWPPLKTADAYYRDQISPLHLCICIDNFQEHLFRYAPAIDAPCEPTHFRPQPLIVEAKKNLSFNCPSFPPCIFSPSTMVSTSEEDWSLRSDKRPKRKMGAADYLSLGPLNSPAQINPFPKYKCLDSLR